MTRPIEELPGLSFDAVKVPEGELTELVLCRPGVLKSLTLRSPSWISAGKLDMLMSRLGIGILGARVSGLPSEPGLRMKGIALRFDPSELSDGVVLCLPPV